MKWFKRWILAFLLGELVVISKKDKSFKKRLTKKKWFKKVKFLFQSLFDFNKDIFNEQKTSLSNMNIPEKLETKIQETKQWAETAYNDLKGKVIDLEKERKNIDKKYIKTTLRDLEKEYTPLYQKVVKVWKEMNEKYDLENKVLDIKKHITKLKRRKI